jgi:hypothetical protein
VSKLPPDMQKVKALVEQIGVAIKGHDPDVIADALVTHIAMYICSWRNQDRDPDMTKMLRMAKMAQHMKDVAQMIVLIDEQQEPKH